jgi:hypothetical protein
MPTNRAFLASGSAGEPATATEMPRSPRARRLGVLGVLGVLLLGACTTGPLRHPPDAGTDTSVDMRVDAPADTGVDMRVDAPADTSADMPADSVAETGTDVPADSGADTGADVHPDSAGADTGADARSCVASSTSSCASSYEAQVAAGANRCPTSNGPRAGRCGRYLVYTEPFFFSPGTTCYYDPTTKAFVAYRYCSDTPDLQDGCICRYAGETISAADECPILGAGTPDERQQICPADGGTASDTRVD